MIKDLTSGRPLRQLVLFSLPFMLSNFLQQAYTLADMVIVGQFVGSPGLAAASNASDIIFLFFFICLGFTTSGQIIVSQHIGAGRRERLSTAIGTLFSFTLLLGAVCTVLPIVFCDRLLGLLNIPEESFSYAHDYAIVCCLGNIPVFGYNAVCAVLRGMGDSRHPTIFVAIASALNIVLDLIFVGPLKMACFGAALATVIAQTVSFIIAVSFIYRRRAAFGFDFRLRSFAIDRAECASLVKLGIPIALQNVLVSISFMFVSSRINVYGVVAAAVTAVGNKLSIAATICTNALYTAGSSIVAQNFAARKLDRVGQTTLYILIISVIFTAILSLLVALLPEQIFGLFDSNPEVIKMSHAFVPAAVISLLGFAGRSAALAFVNGIGFSSLAFAGGLLDGIVARIGLALLLGEALGLGVQGYWIGSALAGHMLFVIGLVYYFMGTWKKRSAIG